MAQSRDQNDNLNGGSFRAAPLPTARLNDEQRLACLRLIRSQNVGSVTFTDLINHYGGAQQALDALPELSLSGGRHKRIKVCAEDDAAAELEAAAQAGATPVFTIEPGFPNAIAQIDAPPPLLYVKGQRELLQRPAVSIVGSRQASAAGLKLTRHFATKLGQAGLVVCSGLARGIDGEAHKSSLGTGTIAVVAGGVDVIYPPEHAELQEAISKEGCLVSMMPCGFKPRGKDFPRRNRLIAAAALGVLVVEAARRSGTLGTARLAGELNRDLFAIPGHPLDPRAEGTNSLLKTGATLVTEPGDILSALEPLTGIGTGAFREIAQAPIEAPAAEPTTPAPQIDSHARELVFGLLGPAPVDFDALVRSAALPVRSVRAILIELDLAGRIERHGSGMVSRRDDAGDG